MLNFLLLTHLIGFAMLAGGAVLSAVVTTAGKRTKLVAEHVVLARLMSRVGALGGGGGMLLALTGTILVWYAGFGFTSTWVILGYVLWIVQVVIAATVSRPFGARLAEAVEAASGQVESDALPALYAANSLGSRLSEVGFTLLLLDMVFKP